MITRIAHHNCHADQKYEFIVRNHTEVPKIVCLCGSTKFYEAFMDANYRETMKGHIVLSVGFFMHAQGNRHGGDVGATSEQKSGLDELHLRKIDLADEVLILNVRQDGGDRNGYIGRSTRREAWYARRKNKTIRFLNPIFDETMKPMPLEEVDAYVDKFFPNWKAWAEAAQEASVV